MKKRFNFLPLLFLCCMMTFNHTSLKAQDAEKQKIINVINNEFEAVKKKDHAKWEAYWIHSPAVRFTRANAFSNRLLVGWDSVNADVQRYFNSKETDDFTNATVKSDFSVTIKGTMAFVDLKTKSGDFVGVQTVVLEKEKGTWKIFRMNGMGLSTYEPTPANIEAQINAQGYRLLNSKKVDEAIKVLTLNTELFPNAFNTWDSLGEAYMIKGDKNMAIAYYQKSVDLNPKNENGKKYLSDLRAGK